MDSLIQYNNAVNAIKTAILQGQYEAAKGVNRIQLALYFAIGKYLSQHTRKGVWGEGALAAISEQLRKELPGLRGFSETQMKDMRRFYEAWNMLDSNSAVATAELCFENSAVATAELQNSENQIDIFHTLSISNIPDFPVEDFFKVPFTHHSAIISVEQIPDLLFFNRELNAMVCIELKLGEFKTSYLGNFLAISKFSTTRCVSHTRIRLLESFFANQQTTLMQNMLFETTASRWELLPTRRWMTCLKGYARLCLI